MRYETGIKLYDWAMSKCNLFTELDAVDGAADPGTGRIIKKRERKQRGHGSKEQRWQECGRTVNTLIKRAGLANGIHRRGATGGVPHL